MLSEAERRKLEDLERSLLVDDPVLAEAFRTMRLPYWSRKAHRRQWIMVRVAISVLGLFLLIGGFLAPDVGLALLGSGVLYVTIAPLVVRVRRYRQETRRFLD